MTIIIITFIYLVGYVLAYVFGKKLFINDELGGRAVEYKIRHRAEVLSVTSLSWIFLLILCVFYLHQTASNSDFFNKPAKW